MAPTWSTDGRQVFYIDGARIMAVTVEPVPGLVAGPPRLAFAIPFAWALSYALARETFDIAREGRRVVTVQPDEDASAAPLHSSLVVIPNFLDELRVKTTAAK